MNLTPQQQLRQATEAACNELCNLQSQSTHLESRIRFYLKVLTGEWPYDVNLATIVAEDLARFEQLRNAR